MMRHRTRCPSHLAELLIDLEEDKAARAVIFGLLAEMERKYRLATGLWYAAKRRPIDAHDPTTTVVTFRIEPIHDRVDEHPFVLVVFVE
jgi:hypothetical protein